MRIKSRFHWIGTTMMLVISVIGGCGQNLPTRPVALSTERTSLVSETGKQELLNAGTRALEPQTEAEIRTGLMKVSLQQDSDSPTSMRLMPSNILQAIEENSGELSNADSVFLQEPYRKIPGFQGYYYQENPQYSGLVVLRQSISTATQGRFIARGLVRNQASQSISTPTISARLLNRDGQELEKCSGVSPVPSLRRGEPAPFELSCNTPASAVAQVQWLTSFSIATTGAFADRDFDINWFWDQPYGKRKPIQSAGGGYEDPTKGPLPYFGYISIANRHEAAIQTSTVIAAWLNDDGKVLWITKALSLDHGTTMADFGLVVQDPEIGPKVSDNHNRMLWAGGN